MDKILHFYYTLNIQSSYYIDFIKFRAYPTVIIHALISYIRIFIELLTACFLLKFKLNLYTDNLTILWNVNASAGWINTESTPPPSPLDSILLDFICCELIWDVCPYHFQTKLHFTFFVITVCNVCFCDFF